MKQQGIESRHFDRHYCIMYAVMIDKKKAYVDDEKTWD